MSLNQIKSVLFGVAIGDALGVPVEFKSRAQLAHAPITEMRGYGTHHQPAGTFSDDSSLAFCLAEAISTGFDLHTVAEHFISWYKEGFWTPHGEVFDIGITTATAINKLMCGTEPEHAGGKDAYSNGNGALMRIAPLLFYLKPFDPVARFHLVHQVGSMTHGHIRSTIACYYYLEFARLLQEGQLPAEAYVHLQQTLPAFLAAQSVEADEIALFDRLLKQDIAALSEEDIRSSGYVLHTLEASVWCLLTTHSYPEAVLKAVNLGEDTDTTGAVTGGLAGLWYGLENIPTDWMAVLARKDDIHDLATRMAANLENH